MGILRKATDERKTIALAETDFIVVRADISKREFNALAGSMPVLTEGGTGLTVEQASVFQRTLFDTLVVEWSLAPGKPTPDDYESLSACTGWLVGNAGHLITNNHCIDTASAALNTNYEFMAEGATCGTSCAAYFSCPGTIVASSATLVQTDVPLDYSLVLLPTNPVATYGFLRLRATPALVDERIYIPGHPGGKGKRISVAPPIRATPRGSARC